MMAKNNENKKCVHCLGVPSEITWDHVIPESWYSVSHSKNVKKPKAPACFTCNNGLGEQEKMLSHLMWMCMPEAHPLRSELVARVFRACGMAPDGKPLLELGEAERHARRKYAEKLLSLSVSSENLDEKSIFPGFGYHAGYPKEAQKVVKIDPESILKVAGKVVRGLEYIQNSEERYIEYPYRLEVYFPRNTNASELELIRRVSPVFSDGTNSIQRGASPQKPLEPIYIIRLWNLWEIWGVIIHEERYNHLNSE